MAAQWGTALSDVQHMIEGTAVSGGGRGGWLQCLLAGAVLGSASEQGHISHHCQKFGGSPHICVGPLTKQPVCQTPDSLAIKMVGGMFVYFVCTCQRDGDCAGS